MYLLKETCICSKVDHLQKGGRPLFESVAI